MTDTINDPLAAASSTGSVPAQEVDIDVTKLTALSHEVISKQATVSYALHTAPNQTPRRRFMLV